MPQGRNKSGLEPEQQSNRSRNATGRRRNAMLDRDIQRIWQNVIPGYESQQPQGSRVVSERIRTRQLGMIPPRTASPLKPLSLRTALQKMRLRSSSDDDSKPPKVVKAEWDRPHDLGDSLTCTYTNLLPDSGCPKSNQMVVIASNQQSEKGVRCFIVSHPHLDSISSNWSRTLKRNIRNTLWHRPKWTKHIVLADDDADSIAILLSIANLRFDKLPSTLTYAGFVRLAMLSERYNLNRFLTEFVASRLDHLRETLLQPGREAWLYVTWQFRLEKEYLDLAHHLMMNCTGDEQGQLLAPKTKQVLKGLPGETSLLGMQAISFCRLKFLAKLLQTLYKVVDYTTSQDTCLLNKATHVDRVFCSSRSGLALHRFLTHHRLLPRLTDSLSIRLSVTQLIDLLSNADIHTYIRDANGKPVTLLTGPRVPDIQRAMTRLGLTGATNKTCSVPHLSISDDHERKCDVGVRLAKNIERCIGKMKNDRVLVDADFGFHLGRV